MMQDRIEMLRYALAAKPKWSLGFYPTHLQKLDKLSKELGVELYLKREDLSGKNLFGGNKIRKLEYLMGEALGHRAEYVITYGATQSNHAMQTVTACRVCGLKPILYLVEVVSGKAGELRSNLLLDTLMGAEIHIVSMKPGETEAEAEERSFELAQLRKQELEAAGHFCFDIPMGGACPVGSLAFAEGFLEITEQLLAKQKTADYLFHATGTGGTLAGLALACKAIESKTQIISINVSEKEESYASWIAGLANQCAYILGIKTFLRPGDVTIDPRYFAPGYEKPNAASIEAIRYLARTEGIFLDPVYTGKAFAGMLDYIRTGKVEPGSTVVFLHTGGATALFAEPEILGELLDTP